VEDTGIGRMLLARTAAGDLVASAFLRPGATEELWLERLARAVSPRVLRRPADLDEVRRELEAYLAGERRGFDLHVDLALATPFQRVVLTGLRESVGYGERTTYGALARRVGRPSASRAVGAALGANPLCVVLPCHRVVASSGALTGYAGGLAAKERLLALEAA
jgi:methylated-DNA-[protein]-cysteine S-methyltransferase